MTSALGDECNADDSSAVIVNMVTKEAVPCSRKLLSVTNRLFDGHMTTGQTLTPEGVPCWAMIFQVTFKKRPEGVIWMSIETDLLRPSLTTRSVWRVVSSVINIFNKLFLKFPWRWNYGTEKHRGSDGKPRGFIQFRFCDAYTLIRTPPGAGPPPDLASFDCEKEYPGIDPGARNPITFDPGHTYTGAVWTQFFCTDRWAVVDLPKAGDISIDDHIGSSPVFLCMRHDQGKDQEQELLIDTAVYHRRVHPEMYQLYTPTASARSPQASLAAKAHVALPFPRPTPVATPCCEQKSARESQTSRVAALALPVFADVLFWLAGRELAFADRAALALAGLAVFAALQLLAGGARDQAKRNTLRPAAAVKEVLPSHGADVPASTMQVAPRESAQTRSPPQTGTTCFSGCLPASGSFFSRRPQRPQ